MQGQRRARRKINYKAFLGLFVIVMINIVAIVLLLNRDDEIPAGTSAAPAQTSAVTTTTTVATLPTVSYATRTSSTATLTAAACSCPNAILIEKDSNTILADKASEARIYPASMTKIMTLVVAAESDCKMTDTFTITSELIEPLVSAFASMAGFAPNEVVMFQDLLYGCALPSGADASTALSIMVGGSEVQFVNLMNQKALEIGMKNTHFMNESGLHDTNHYSTAQDIALLLDYAMQNPICKTILSSKEYVTSKTEQHPQGLLLQSTMFSRMTGAEVPGVTILGGKTGFTDQAGNCLASFAEQDGRTYLAVVAGGADKPNPISDTISLYSKYLPQTPGSTAAASSGTTIGSTT